MRELRGEFRLRLLRARRRRRAARVASLLVAEGDVPLDGGRRQAFTNRELARKLVLGKTLVRQLVGKRIEHRILIACRYAGAVGKEGKDILSVCLRLVDDDVTALKERRFSRIMGIDRRRMAAVVFKYERIDALLVDDAALCFRCTANEVRDAALRIIKLSGSTACPCLDRRHRAGAHILVVLIIALVAAFIEPLCAVLQIKIRRAAVVDETMQIRLVRHKGDIKPARGQSKEIAVELHVSDCIFRLAVAWLRPIFSHIHGNRALICGERVVAILHTGRHLDGATACEAYAAVLGIRRHAIAVDGHIHITVYGHRALFDLCQNACIIKAREYILTIERNAPLIRLLACNLQIAVDADSRGDARFIGFFPQAVALLNCDAVAAKAACHRDIERSVDGKLSSLFFHCIELDGIRQRIAAVKPPRKDIDSL